uniref:Uncharacterized protein n=1 Tax=Solanum tuberosum TaxID=4113 RepID=M1DG16_SOLTU
MEAKHRVDMASRTPSFGVGSYGTGFHGLLSWSILVNAYSYHVRSALWFLEKFYEVQVLVWDVINALHE